MIYISPKQHFAYHMSYSYDIIKINHMIDDVLTHAYENAPIYPTIS